MLTVFLACCLAGVLLAQPIIKARRAAVQPQRRIFTQRGRFC